MEAIGLFLKEGDYFENAVGSLLPRYEFPLGSDHDRHQAETGTSASASLKHALARQSPRLATFIGQSTDRMGVIPKVTKGRLLDRSQQLVISHRGRTGRDRCGEALRLGRSQSHLAHAVIERLAVLGLEIKPSWQVFDIEKQGLDFVGFVFRYTHILLRKSIATKFKRKALIIERYWQKMTKEKIINGIMSYWGWVKPVNAKNLWRSVVTIKLLHIIDLISLKHNPARYTT